MPRKYSRQHFDIRKSRKKGTVPAPRQSVPRSLAPVGKSTGFPNQKVVTLKYVQNFTIVSSLGGVTQKFFRANGIYDPDYTGSGHQPYLSDTWKSLYNHYTVISSNMRATVNQLGNTNQVNQAIGVYTGDDFTNTLTFDTLRESGRGSQVIQPWANTESKRVYTRYDRDKFFDKRKDLSASVGADPVEAASFLLYCQSTDMSSTGNTLDILVEIEYKVRFFEPKDVPQS